MTELTLDAPRTALLCLHFQNDIISDSPLAPSDPEPLARLAAALEATGQLLAQVRMLDVAVIHVRIAFSPGYPEVPNPNSPMLAYMKKHDALVEGTLGAAIHPKVAPIDGEAVFTNRAVSAFAGSPLAAHLAARGIDTVLLTGLVTHFVVEGSARDAADRGLRFVVVEDCCASATPERHEAALVNLRFLGRVADREVVAGAVSP